jgi:hypothetical protein
MVVTSITASMSQSLEIGRKGEKTEKNKGKAERKRDKIPKKLLTDKYQRTFSTNMEQWRTQGRGLPSPPCKYEIKIKRRFSRQDNNEGFT